ncbi:MAG TPA: acetyl-CoA carboxylase carboxyltransferase subunit beta [Nitrospirales bacterium]|nr:acetyl-CoA carboxylase carboxyltransferase subunit beta [Nitrospirales bacterium]
MAWFKKRRSADDTDAGPNISEGLWLKCPVCRETIFRKEFERNGKICPKCEYHFPITVDERIGLLLDAESFTEWEKDLQPKDILGFKDTQPYTDRLKRSQDKTGRADAIVIGEGRINGHHINLSVFDFSFMGGSMGTVVGEKVLITAEASRETRTPLIIISTSGGARMQEGMFSLMQMAKTAAAIGRLSDTGVPFISVLTDPTFGGVTASFAMLGDIIIAEPKALIGFAGPRVIEQTIKQRLPKGFQRAEFLLEHGMIDMIVPRRDMKATLTTLLAFF